MFDDKLNCSENNKENDFVKFVININKGYIKPCKCISPAWIGQSSYSADNEWHWKLLKSPYKIFCPKKKKKVEEKLGKIMKNYEKKKIGWWS